MGTTPVFGFPYPDPSDLVANYPATAQTLAEDVETEILASGSMKLITSATISTSPVNINTCFSAAYDVYMVTVTVTNSTDSDLFLRMRNAGTTDTGNNYDLNWWTVSNTTFAAARATAQSGIRLGAARTTDLSAITLMIYNPFVATDTMVTGYGYDSALEASVNSGVGRHDVASSHDSFVLYPGGGTFSAGKIYVYGLKNS
jgi:hypothetical protein